MLLVIDRNNSSVEYAAGSLLVDQPGRPRWRAPVNQLEMVIVYGSAMVASSVWRALAAAGVPAVLLPSRGQQPPAILGAGLAAQLPLRRMQHRCAEDSDRATALAAWIIDHKLQACHLPLLRLRQSCGADGRAACDAVAEKLDTTCAALARATSVPAVMGMEGSVARAWFGLLAETLPRQWKFTGRNRRPPRDPVNALLSLGYTLLHAEARQVAVANGLDPALGFVHQDCPGREGAVLDLCEPFRAGVDWLVIDLILTGELRPKDFYYREKEGCRLSKHARPVFYQHWASHRETWPHPQGAAPAPLRQRLTGFIQQLREKMNELETGND